MANDTRNPMDVIRDRVARNSGVPNAASPINAGGSAGSGARGSFSLGFRGPDGVPKMWFKWGRHDFDNDNAIFY